MLAVHTDLKGANNIIPISLHPERSLCVVLSAPRVEQGPEY